MPTIQFRRGTASEWLRADPILAAGEPGFETDSGRHKIGDGTRRWSRLSYFVDQDAIAKQIAASRDGAPGSAVAEIRVLTQAAYEALTTDPATLYLIVD